MARTKHETGSLQWCRHHYQEHEELLTPLLVAYTIYNDDTAMAEANR